MKVETMYQNLRLKTELTVGAFAAPLSLAPRQQKENGGILLLRRFK